MKQKFTYLLILLIFSALVGVGNFAKAQSVTGTAVTNGCKSGGTITASSTGLGATPQYQLLLAGAVVAPDASNPSVYTNSNVFTSLINGNYTLNARASLGGTVYTSSTITVTNGYADMVVSTPTKVLTCVGTSTTLTTTVTGGKASYIYKIANQTSPSTIIESSAATAATSYTFGATTALPKGNYIVSVTDNCGITTTSATSISDPTVTLADIKVGSVAYFSRNNFNDCNSTLKMVVEFGWQYVANSVSISASDAAKFTWKIRFQNQLYGQDITGDGRPDVGGAGFSPLTSQVTAPLAADRAAALADELTATPTAVVLMDACGNSKVIPIINYNNLVSRLAAKNCSGNATVVASLGAGIACFPINYVFTNTSNPADVITVTQTTATQQFTGFTPGSTYHFTYVDGAGYTTGVWSNAGQNISISATSSFAPAQFYFGPYRNLNALNYGQIALSFSPGSPNDPVSVKVLSSSSPLVPVGTIKSGVLDGGGNWVVPNVNSTDPINYWPKGTYTLELTSVCGIKNLNVTVLGYTASLTGNTISPICGGFDYVVNGIFDDATAYQVIILPGSASNVGQTRDLASTTASLPFNGLTNGNYTFGIRIKGGTTDVLTQTVTLSAANVLSINKSATGGYVCTTGATNGTLTIVASTLSPAPGNTLEYAIGGHNIGDPYGAFQSGNTFTGLSEGTYYFKVKDGCGNIITESTQIGVAAAPTARVDGKASPAPVCKYVGATMQMDVDALGAGITYNWSGPGISNTVGDPAYKGLKNPQVSLDPLTVGTLNYSVSIVNPACSATPTVSNISVNLKALPVATIAYSANLCKTGTAAVTQTGTTGGTYSALPTGLTIDANTGALNLATSAAGTYTVTYTFTDGSCPTTTTASVTVNDLPLQPTVAVTQPSCGTPTGSLTITAVTGETYSLDGGAYSTTLTYSGLVAGSTHTVTAKNAGTCTAVTSVTMDAAKVIATAPTVAVTAQPTCAVGTGSINITAKTGETYSLDGGAYAATTTYTGLASGSHSVTAKSVDGCISTATSVIINTAPGAPTAPTVAVTAQPTCAVVTGSISITAVTGETYSVNGGAYSATTTYTGLASGSHTVTAKNAGGCTSSATSVTINAAPATATTPIVNVVSQPTCGVPTGSMSITAVTGETYSLDGGAYSATTIYSGLTPGSHNVTAKTAGGCTSTATSFTINAAKVEATVPVVTVTVQPTCTVSTGTIGITAVTGETYSVDGGAYSATTTYAGLTVGSHSVTSKSIDGCLSVPTSVTINAAPAAPAAPTVIVTGQPDCSVATGIISITAVTGLTYSLDGGAYSATTSYTGLTAGSHSVIAKNGSGCTSAPTTVTINAAPVGATAPTVAVTAQPSCAVGTGSISITAKTGETYSVDGNAYSATTTYTGLTSGSHSITAQSVDGCISTATSVTINAAPLAPTAPVANATQPTCTVGTGSLTITTVTGETYSLDGGAYSATATYTGLTAGLHNVTAKSAGGCISSATSVTINAAPSAPAAPTVAVTAQPTCVVGSGTISITAVAGLTYSVDGGAYSATTTYTGLTVGSHSVTAKNVAGCISTATSVTINAAPSAPVAPTVAVTAQPTCAVGSGSISITAVTGLTYSLDGGSYSATTTYTGLTVGSHSVTAKNVAGCISTATSVTINAAPSAPTAPVLTATQPTCTVGTGSIAITTVTGETYSLDGGAYSATATYTGLTVGSHSVMAKSSGGCISTATSVTINSAPSAPAAPTVAVTAQPTCAVGTGSISIASVTGLTYSLDGGAYSATTTYTGLTVGLHSVMAKSSGGCLSTATSVTINAAPATPSAPIVTATQPICGTPTGSINITAVTGETYSVDGGAYATTTAYSGLAAGLHSILAKNGNGCISTATSVTIDIALAVPTAPIVTAIQPTCALATGSINITPVSGNTYSIDGSAYVATLAYAGLATGTHTITAKNASGCISNATSIVINAQPATPTATISYPSAQYQATGTTAVTQTGQAGGTYSASPSGLSIDATTGAVNLGSSTPNQTYTITYAFSNGTCTNTTSTTIKINSTPATIGYGKPEYCATGSTDVLRTGPASGIYTVNGTGLKINSSTGTINLSSSTPGSYTVTYTYQDGSITAVATTSIVVNAMPIVSLNSDLGLDISKGDIAILTATGGVSYSWTGGDILSGQNTASLRVRPKQTTTYTVTATNASGCSEVMQITINVTDDLKLLPNNVVTPNGDGKNDTWVVKNIDYYPNNDVSIYDRAGRKVYGAKGYQNNWDGTYNGMPLAEGAYIYVIDLGKGIGLIRGTISIIRDNR